MRKILIVLFPLLLLGCTNTIPEPSPEAPLDQTESPLPTSSPVSETNGCVRAGCSNQLCVDQSDADDIMTTCEYKDEYACLEQSVCERQANGECGWSESDEYISCMANLESKTIL